MERDIRRKDRAITEQEARAVLDKAEYGFLGTAGPEGQPYTVPLSFVVLRDHIYFHCATEGRKLEYIAARPTVCFAAVGRTEPVFEGSFGSYYESALVYGTCRRVTDDAEKREALMELARKYLPEYMDHAGAYIDKAWSRTLVYAISMDRVTGKSKKKKA